MHWQHAAHIPVEVLPPTMETSPVAGLSDRSRCSFSMVKNFTGLSIISETRRNEDYEFLILFHANIILVKD